jgi:molybdate transport system regulatory protein
LNVKIKNKDMKLSTRNQWKGTVKNITEGVVNSEVQMALSETVLVTAIITNGAVRNLDLKTGDDVIALIKASEIMLGYDVGLISARNILDGKVSEVKIGAVNAEITVDLKNGVQVISIITKTSAEKLEIKSGKEISVIIKASSVMIAKE